MKITHWDGRVVWMIGLTLFLVVAMGHAIIYTGTRWSEPVMSDASPREMRDVVAQPERRGVGGRLWDDGNWAGYAYMAEGFRPLEIEVGVLRDEVEELQYVISDLRSEIDALRQERDGLAREK